MLDMVQSNRDNVARAAATDAQNAAESAAGLAGSANTTANDAAAAASAAAIAAANATESAGNAQTTADGAIPFPVVGPTAPESPRDGAFWIDTNGPYLKCAFDGTWFPVASLSV